MAQTSSAFSGIPNAQYTRLYLDFWVASQSTANNQTTFGYKLVIGGVDGGSGSTQGGAYTFSNAWSASASGLTWSWSTSSHTTIREGTFVVTHNADGTLSNRTLTAAASFVTSGGTATASTSVTISVPTIPRYAAITTFTASIDDRSADLDWAADKTISQWRWSTNSGSSYSAWITVNASSGSISGISVTPGSTYGFRIQVKNSASGLITTSSVVSKTATKTPSTLTFINTTSQDIGSGIEWKINESYDYTHKIKYFFGNASEYILGSDVGASNTLEDTWIVPTSLANQIPNATSGSGKLRLYTYYGSTLLGFRDYTFTAKVPNNATWQPAIPDVEISDAVTQPAGITSYVQGKSKANVISSSTAKGGASISSYRVLFGGGIGSYYGSNITSGTLTLTGNIAVTVRATDSRGYYREKYNVITVVPYSPPKLTTYTAKRSPNEQGTNLATSINFSISPVDSQNTKQYRIRYRPTGGTWVSLVDSTAYYSRDITHSATDVLDANISYEVEFYIKDSYTSVTQTRNIGTAFQLLDFNASGRGVAFGKVSESNKFEVGMPVEFSTIDFKMPNGRGAAYLSNTADLNDVVEEWVLGSNGSNYPGTGSWYVHTIMYGSLAQRKQIAYGYQNNDVFTRYLFGGTWSTWEKTVDSGSNTNGRYVRFSDGTQICWGSVAVSATPFAWAGSLFRTDYLPFTFASSFSEAPTCTLSYLPSNSNAAWEVLRTLSTSSGSYSLIRPAASELSGTLHFMVIGRWK